MSELRALFGSRVRHFRKQRGLTQAAVAEAAGVSLETVTRIERGVVGVRFEAAERIAAALKVQPAALFSLDASLHADHRIRPVLERLMALSEAEILWASDLLETALKKPR